MRDTVNMLRQGVPTVGLVHEPFRTLSKMQVAQLGMPGAPLLIYPQDVPSHDPPEFVAQKAQQIASTIAEMLLDARQQASAQTG